MRSSEYLVALREVFLLLTSIVLLQVHASIEFHGFSIHIYLVETSQLIPENMTVNGNIN